MASPDVAGEERAATPPQSGYRGQTPPTGESRSSILETLRTISGIGLSMFHSRLDLFATELEEERRRAGWALIFGGILFAAAMGASFSGLLFVFALAAWFNLLIVTAGVFSLTLAIVALVMILRLRALYSQRDKFFHYTLEEVRKDIVGIRRVFIKKGSE